MPTLPDEMTLRKRFARVDNADWLRDHYYPKLARKFAGRHFDSADTRFIELLRREFNAFEGEFTDGTANRDMAERIRQLSDRLFDAMVAAGTELPS